MRVVVTGGSGKAGRAVVADLVAHGHDVTNVDVNASPDPDAPTLVADLTDRGQVFDVLDGAEAVVHLAAIPAPNIRPVGETFRINMMSTYNVFSAAVAWELSRVVWASSETLIGTPFEKELPRYAPIDEGHELLPEFGVGRKVLAHDVERRRHVHATECIGGDLSGQQFEEDSRVPVLAVLHLGRGHTRLQ